MMDSYMQCCRSGVAQGLLWDWGAEDAQAMVGSVGLQATSQTSGYSGSNRMCATMRFVSTCQARIPLPLVPTSLQHGVENRHIPDVH